MTAFDAWVAEMAELVRSEAARTSSTIDKTLARLERMLSLVIAMDFPEHKAAGMDALKAALKK